MMKEKPVNELQVRSVRFVPQDIEFIPANPTELTVKEGVHLTLACLFGQTPNGGSRIDATGWNSLKVSCYGSDYLSYSVTADTAPAAFSVANQLSSSKGLFHRFDFLIETQEAEIRFYLEETLSWGAAIPLTVGNHSIEFSSRACQIRQRGGVAGTYTIVGCQ